MHTGNGSIYNGRRKPRVHRGDVCKYLERFTDSSVCSLHRIQHDSTVAGSFMSLLSLGCRIEFTTQVLPSSVKTLCLEFYFVPLVYWCRQVPCISLFQTTFRSLCIELRNNFFDKQCIVRARLVAHFGIKSSWICSRQPLQQICKPWAKE